MLEALGVENRVVKALSNHNRASKLHDLMQEPAMYYVAPSYVDLQVNGYKTVSLDENYSIEALLNMSEAMRLDGTAVFVPTVITCDYDYMVHVLEVTSDFMTKYPNRIFGVHLEGPFISKERAGIHPKHLIRTMDDKDVALLLKFKGAIAYITCSPEALDESKIQALQQANIRLSLGHSTANFEQATNFLKQGVKLGTHLYNAMSKASNGRTPGCVEALLLNKVYSGVICDGVHVAWPLVKLAYELLGSKFVLVTDAIAAAGVKEVCTFPHFKFAGVKIINDPVKGCVDINGTLAGSRLDMANGVRNLVNNIGLSPLEAIQTATLNPCLALGTELTSYVNILDSKLQIIEPCLLV